MSWVAITNTKLNPRTYHGDDKYGKYTWERARDIPGEYARWHFETEAMRDKFIADHQDYEAKFGAPAINAGGFMYGPLCGSDGFQDYPLDPDCDLVEIKSFFGHDDNASVDGIYTSTDSGLMGGTFSNDYGNDKLTVAKLLAVKEILAKHAEEVREIPFFHYATREEWEWLKANCPPEQLLENRSANPLLDGTLGNWRGIEIRLKEPIPLAYVSVRPLAPHPVDPECECDDCLAG